MPEDEAATSDALTVEFTRLFDAGARGTACPLNGGLQVGPQMKVMEEAVRFYAHFGLTLTEEQKELPDHLTTELNFLHFLSCGEHEPPATVPGTERIAGPPAQARSRRTRGMPR